ncbi:MAG: extracellular solute-binding protein [Candidatus Limivivens sp.]|nr:extracellular solute-binding protein [Candidatus Limivivens sp.]
MKRKQMLALLMTGCMAMSMGIAANAESSEEPVKLSVLWQFDPSTDSHWKQDCLYTAAEALGYELEVESVDDATYKTKIRVMLQANELPDVFYTWGGSYSTPFLDAGVLYPLEDALDESGYKLMDVYAQPEADGHIYAVPTSALETYAVFYNKDVFADLGMEVPETWDELLAVVDACNEKGIAAMALGDKDRWEGDLFYNMMVIREDADAFKNAMEGDGSFTDEAFLTAAEKVQTLVEKGAFHKGYMQAGPNECIEMLRAGLVAMYPTGSWNVATFEGEENIGCAVFPGTGAEDPYLSCCGNAANAGMCVSVSDKSEYAAKFVVEYTKQMNDRRTEEGDRPYYETDVESKDITELRQTYNENCSKLEKSQLWWYTYLDTEIGEPMRDLSQRQFAGQIEAKEFTEELQKIIKGE